MLKFLKIKFRKNIQQNREYRWIVLKFMIIFLFREKIVKHISKNLAKNYAHRICVLFLYIFLEHSNSILHIFSSMIIKFSIFHKGFAMRKRNENVFNFSK